METQNSYIKKTRSMKRINGQLKEPAFFVDNCLVNMNQEGNTKGSNEKYGLKVEIVEEP